MNPTFAAIQVLNGVSLGMVLFLLASGLALITGMMGIVNLAQGSYFLLGAYSGMTLLKFVIDNFVLAALVGAIVGAALGVLMQRFFLYRFYKNDLAQVLLTFGFLFMFQDLGYWIFGDMARNATVLSAPGPLALSVRFLGITYPSYRLFLIGFGIVVALGLWLLIERTRVGAIIRAGVDDADMLRAVGVDVPLLFTVVFALGAALAGLGGVIGGPFLGVHPGEDLDVLLLAFVVLIVGGLGSLKGAFIGSLLIGLLDTFGRALFPELSQFTVFAPMALILAIKPSGLFGRA
jgi:branched-chain amino acid transport system permease protein